VEAAGGGKQGAIAAEDQDHVGVYFAQVAVLIGIDAGNLSAGLEIADQTIQ